MAGYWKVMGLSEKATSPAMGEWPARAPGPDEVVVRLRAAALNFADLLMQEGSYQETPALPFIPGLEGAGEVLAAGPGVALRPGTRVAVHAQGTMAEANVFPADRCVPIPDRMPWVEAAGFLIAYGTSHLALVHRGGLRAGETVAVLGGLDSIPGALVAGLLLGVVENVGSSWLDPLVGGGSRDLIVAVVLILTVMLRPHGFFGRHDIERV